MRTKSELLREAHTFFPDHWKLLCSTDLAVSPRTIFPTFQKLYFGQSNGFPDVNFDILLENGEIRRLWAVYKCQPEKTGWSIEGASVVKFKRVIEEFLDCFLAILMSEEISMHEWNALPD